MYGRLFQMLTTRHVKGNFRRREKTMFIQFVFIASHDNERL